jgi:hypothetical protein
MHNTGIFLPFHYYHNGSGRESLHIVLSLLVLPEGGPRLVESHAQEAPIFLGIIFVFCFCVLFNVVALPGREGAVETLPVLLAAAGPSLVYLRHEPRERVVCKEKRRQLLRRLPTPQSNRGGVGRHGIEVVLPLGHAPGAEGQVPLDDVLRDVLDAHLFLQHLLRLVPAGMIVVIVDLLQDQEHVLHGNETHQFPAFAVLFVQDQLAGRRLDSRLVFFLNSVI